ncbi:MAG TPA: hypothetical protein VNJ70_20775 [Thermoanaerobaculia bacterium]|nr:hypothetical protein [Thermoanaerobaculia bacterium]
MNRVVAHFQDGRLLKGFTYDFLPGKDVFHLADPAPGARPEKVPVAELKAIFFVKTFDGDPQRPKVNDPAAAAPAPGRRIRIVFKDGEVLVGTTQGYDPARPGFFVVPIDRGSNNERCFVVAAATREVGFL